MVGSKPKESVDPLVSLLDTQEQNIVNTILQFLAHFFPDQKLGHKIKSIADSYFVIYVANFTILDMNYIKRMITPHRTYFRHFEVSPDIESGTIGLEISFYKTSERGKYKPLGFQSKSGGIQCEDFLKSLSETGLSHADMKYAKDLLEQFCFVERYSSGNIFATIEEKDDYYCLIFSNVKMVHSGFLAVFMHSFGTLRMSVRFSSAPFEVFLEVEKTDQPRVRKRLIDQDAGTSKKRRE